MSSPKMPRSNSWVVVGMASTTLVPTLIFDHPSGLRVLSSLDPTDEGEKHHVSASRERAPVSDADMRLVREDFDMQGAEESNTSPSTMARLRAEGRKLGPFPARHLWLRAAPRSQRSSLEEIEAALAMMFPAPPPGWEAGPTVRPDGKNVVRWFVRGELRVMVMLGHSRGEDAVCVGVITQDRAPTERELDLARRDFGPEGAGPGEARPVKRGVMLVWTMSQIESARALIVARRAGRA